MAYGDQKDTSECFHVTSGNSSKKRFLHTIKAVIWWVIYWLQLQLQAKSQKNAIDTKQKDNAIVTIGRMLYWTKLSLNFQILQDFHLTMCINKHSASCQNRNS